MGPTGIAPFAQWDGRLLRLNTLCAQNAPGAFSRHGRGRGDIDLSNAAERGRGHPLVEHSARRTLAITRRLHQRLCLGFRELDPGRGGVKIRQRGDNGSEWITGHVGTLTFARRRPSKKPEPLAYRVFRRVATTGYGHLTERQTARARARTLNPGLDP